MPTNPAVRELAQILGEPAREMWDLGEPTTGGELRLRGGTYGIAIGRNGEDWRQTAWSVERRVQALATRLRDAPAGCEILVHEFPHGVSSLLEAMPFNAVWTWAVRLCESVALVTETASAAGNAEATRRLPSVHRTRFVLLNTSTLVKADTSSLARERPLGPTLAARAEAARSDWFLDLVNHEERPSLREWREDRIDEELRLVVAPGFERDGGVFERWVLRDGFLPRFMLLDGWKRLTSTARWGAGMVGALLALLVLIALATLWIGPSRTLLEWVVGGLAALAYVSLVLTAGFGDRMVAYLACLRLPAGAAVGLLAITAFGADWVLTPGLWWVGASVALLAASWAYLFLEVTAHGSSPARGLARAGLVAVLGFAHGVAVAAIVVPVIGRAIVADLDERLSQLSASGYAQLLVLAASTGLAAGVFLQVLWDDKPVTYPLTYLEWRGRTKG